MMTMKFDAGQNQKILDLSQTFYYPFDSLDEAVFAARV